MRETKNGYFSPQGCSPDLSVKRRNLTAHYHFTGYFRNIKTKWSSTFCNLLAVHFHAHKRTTLKQEYDNINSEISKQRVKPDVYV